MLSTDIKGIRGWTIRAGHYNYSEQRKFPTSYSLKKGFTIFKQCCDLSEEKLTPQAVAGTKVRHTVQEVNCSLISHVAGALL